MKEITKGKSGAALVRATVSFGDGPVTDDLAIKFGDPAAIRSEAMRYDRFCGPLPDGVVAQLRWRVETDKLGALAYSWVGDAVEDGKALNADGVNWGDRRETIERLFNTSLRPWVRIFHAGTSASKTPLPLTKYYAGKGGLWYEDVGSLDARGLPLTGPQLLQPVVARGGQWHFGAFGSYLDPVRWVLEGRGSTMTFLKQAPTHGDLHTRNVFVLPGNLPRLIDFGRTALGHVFRDFAALETSLRLTCVQPESGEAAREIEDYLCGTTGLGDAIVSDGALDADAKYHSRQVIETIKVVRRAAADCCSSKNSSDDMAQYHFAVLMHLIRYAMDIADEVTRDSEKRKAIRLWQAHYGAARLASFLDASLSRPT